MARASGGARQSAHVQDSVQPPKPAEVPPPEREPVLTTSGSNAVYEEPPPLPMIYDFDPNDPVWTYEILDFTDDVRRICPRLLQDKKLLGWQIDCEDPDIPGKFRLKMERSRLEQIHRRMQNAYDNLRMQRPTDPNLVVTDSIDKSEIVTADQIAKHLQASS